MFYFIETKMIYEMRGVGKNVMKIYVYMYNRMIRWW